MPRQLLRLSLLLAFVLFSAAILAAQGNPESQRTPGPPDKPVTANSDQLAKYEAAIAPYVQRARDTLPDAKNRYLGGLSKGEILYVTIRLNDPQGRFEQAFVKVNSWTGSVIKGTLASDMDLVKKYKRGDVLTCRESQVMDWTISKPDGTEEGNFVGKFLDTYKPN